MALSSMDSFQALAWVSQLSMALSIAQQGAQPSGQRNIRQTAKASSVRIT